LNHVLRYEPADHRSKNPLIEPVRTAHQNRRGAQWSNTRDTAITILALNTIFARAAIKSRPGIQLLVNGFSITTQKVTPADVLKPSRFVIDPKYVRTAQTKSDSRKKGQGWFIFSPAVLQLGGAHRLPETRSSSAGNI
jgi:hypothetical protein